MPSYIDIGDPITKPVGEKDVVAIDCTPYLGGGETVASVTAAPEPGITSVVVTGAQVAPGGTSVNVAYELPGPRHPRIVRILVTIQSSNAKRVAATRAIPIRIA